MSAPSANSPSASSWPATGGQAMAQQLAEEGVTHIFGVPGVQLDYATDGLQRLSDQITFITARHEQTTTYAADGYARSTGRVGVAMVVPGPGVLNAASGLATALATSSKVLLISGQLATRAIGQGWGMLHEIPDQSGILARLCRSSTLATTPDEVAGSVHGAMALLASGPGPVAVELPPDVLRKTTDGPIIGAEPGGTPHPGDVADLDDVAAKLAESERPMIVAGGGAAAAGAWAEVHGMAELLGAPLVASPHGRATVNSEHHLAFPTLALDDLAARSDLILFVGSRAMDNYGRAVASDADAARISINVDDGAFSPPRSFDATIVGDAKSALASLATRLTDDGPRRPWLEPSEAEVMRGDIATSLASLVPQVAYLEALRDAMADDGVLVNELTQVGYVARYAWPNRHPRSFIDPGYQGTLGYGFPTAIGAAVGNPDRPVVSITGDGGFGFGLAELATVAHYNIPLVTVVFHDNAYGNVQRMHQQQFDGVAHGTSLTNPDFLALAAAYDIAGYRASTPDELRRVLSTAIDQRQPALIAVPMGEVPDPWPILLSSAQRKARSGA